MTSNGQRTEEIGTTAHNHPRCQIDSSNNSRRGTSELIMERRLGKRRKEVLLPDRVGERRRDGHRICIVSSAKVPIDWKIASSSKIFQLASG
jgi:hypothetical protein